MVVSHAQSSDGPSGGGLPGNADGTAGSGPGRSISISNPADFGPGNDPEGHFGGSPSPNPNSNPDGFGSPVGEPGDVSSFGGGVSKSYDGNGSISTATTSTGHTVNAGANDPNDSVSVNPSQDSQGRGVDDPNFAGRPFPILLDLDGNGISIQQLNNSTVFVDAGGEGLLHRTAWAAAGNGVLFYDADGDGTISEKREYVFTEWDPTATSDIEALRAVFDSNGDGVFDANDAEWANFKVMVTQDDGSLVAQTLAQLGITSIDLTADATNIELPDGSVITGKTTFTKSDGTTGTVADTTLAAEVQSYRVESTESTDGTGTRTHTQTGYASDGSIAFEITSVASSDGSAITNSYDNNGDGVVDRLQTIDTTDNPDGSDTELVTNKVGADQATGILVSRTATTTSANGDVVTIERDSVGGGWFDQIETRTTDANDSMTIVTQDLGQDGSIIRSSTETVSSDGLVRSDAIDEDGDGVVDLTIDHVIVVHANGSRDETITHKNSDGTVRSSVTESVSADGRDKTILRDVDGDGDTDTEDDLLIVVNGDDTTTSTLTVLNQDASVRNSTTQTQSDDSLIKTIESDSDGDGDIDLKSVEAVTIHANGSRETVTMLTNTDGSVRGKEKVILAADKVATETWVDLNQNGVFESTDLVKSVTVDGATQERTAQMWSRNADGSIAASDTTVTSADGLNRQTDIDADGDGDTDTSVSDVTVVDANGVAAQTIEMRNQDGSLRDRTIVTTSADSLVTSSTYDRDGDGVLDAQASSVRSLNADGSTDHTTMSYAGDGSTVLSQTVEEASADRRVQTSTIDLDGDGAADLVMQSVEALSGATTIVETAFAQDGTVISASQTDISDDGLVQTFAQDLDGDGVDDVETTSSTTLNADGSRTTVTVVRNGDGSLRSEASRETSDDGLITIATVDADGNGTDERVTTSTTTLNADGSATTIVDTDSSSGALLFRSTRTISDDGLIATTGSDADGDGTADLTTTATTTLLQDGGTEVEVELRDATGVLRSASKTEANDNLRDVTVSRDVNGDGNYDAIETAIVADNGTATSTVSTYDSDGTTLQSRTQSITSDDGLTSTVKLDADGDGTYERVQEDVAVLNADGSVFATMRSKSADGQTYSLSTRDVSDDGLSVTETSDWNNDGTVDATTTVDVDLSLDGIATTTSETRAADGSLITRSEDVVSADGRTTTMLVDQNGDGVDDVETRVTTDQSDRTTSDIQYFDAENALEARFVSTRSANGFDTTRRVDRDGDGIFEYVTTRLTSLLPNGNREVETTHRDAGGALLARETFRANDDGLVLDTDFDLDGDGQADLLSVDTMSYAANGDTTRVMTTHNDQSNLLASITQVTSGDGLTTTNTTDVDGDGSDNRVVSTVRGASGGLVETVQEHGTNGVLQRSTSRDVSDDGWTDTMSTDRDGDGLNDLQMVVDVDLSLDVTQTYRDLTGIGATAAEITMETSANGMEQVTLFDLDGDGSHEIEFQYLTSFDASGSRIETFSETMGVNTLTYQTISTYAADGLSSTMTIDVDGDGDIDGTSLSTTTLNTDGSRETVRDVHYADGTLRSKHVTQQSADGREIIESFDFDGNGENNTETQTRIAASGAREIIDIGFNDDGDELNRTVTTTSADGLVTTVLQDGFTEVIERSVLGNGNYTWFNGRDNTSTSAGDTGFLEDFYGDIAVSHTFDAFGIETWTISSDISGSASAATNQDGDVSVRLDAAGKARLLSEAARIFDTVLDRDMDRSETELLVQFASNGQLDREDLADSLVGSNEFDTRYGALTDAEFVTQMHLNALGRAPSLAELSDDIQALDTGTSRKNYVTELAESAEHLVIGNGHRITNNFDVIVNSAEFERNLDRAYVEDMVQNLVDVIYDRAATDHELEYLTNLLMDGTDDAASVASQLLAESGDQYGIGTNSLQGLTGAALVTQAFQNGLDRAPTSAELSDWQSHLSSGLITSEQFVASLAQSIDHLGAGNQFASGSPSTTTQNGSSSANSLTGTTGQDLMQGFAGNDTLNGAAGSDELIGGTGNDALTGGDGSDVYVWARGDGDDIITDSGQSKIEADVLSFTNVVAADVTLQRNYLSNDLIITVSGANGGAITVTDQFDEVSSGGLGIELIEFSDGTIWNSGKIDDEVQVVGTGNSAAHTIYGVAGNDLLNGGGGNDLLEGGDGNDSLYSSSGNDIAFGGAGDDVLTGANGNDQLVGGAGADSLWGGDGSDTLWGEAGVDSLNGQDGFDTLYGGAGADVLNGDDGNDVLNGWSGNDQLIGGNNNDTLNGESGDDFLEGGAGADSLDGGEGSDTASYADSTIGVVSDLAAGTGSGGTAAGDTYSSIENIDGSGFADALDGDTANNFLKGNQGNDTINGGAGDDSIYGGGSHDTIDGGDGNDYLKGDSGNDLIYGRDGSDVIRGWTGADTFYGGNGADDLAGGDDNDTIFGEGGDDRIRGDNGNDVLSGGAGNDDVRGWAGDDTLSGNDGEDFLRGGDGADHLSGGNDNDHLMSDAGNDVLLGESGADSLDGGSGNDTLTGGSQDDTLRGGSGADQFVVGLGDGVDTIEDFKVDEDVLELIGHSGTLHVLQSETYSKLLLDTSTSIFLNWTDPIDLTSANFVGTAPTSINIIAPQIDASSYVVYFSTTSGGRVDGATTADLLLGNSGNDDLRGANGTDLLVDGEGADVLRGGNHADYFLLVADGDTDRITDFQDGLDIIDISAWGVTSIDQLIMWGEFDNQGVSKGRGYIDFGDERIRMDGMDQAEFDALTVADFVFDFELAPPEPPEEPEDPPVPGETITGTSGKDTLQGGDGNDIIDGLGNNDKLYGGAGDDSFSDTAGNNEFYGEAGNDVMSGGGGHDWYEGGLGNDTMTGNGGRDVFAFDDGDGNDVITDFSIYHDSLEFNGIATAGPDSVPSGVTMVQTGADVLVSYGTSDTVLIQNVLIVEWQPLEKQYIQGTSSSELIEGRENEDSLYGNGGNDTIYGHGRKDKLYGGDGNDVLDGGGSNDSLYGGNGNDTLTDVSGNNKYYGDAGDDFLIGAGGHDHFTGGTGDDVITGGGGRDQFYFDDGFGDDIITDFSVTETTERIHLDDVTAITNWTDLVANHLSQVGSDVVIDDGAENTITLQNEVLGTFTSDEFVF